MDEYAALGRFGHREHLHLAWSCLRRRGVAGARHDVARLIRHIARSHGQTDRVRCQTPSRKCARARRKGLGSSPFAVP